MDDYYSESFVSMHGEALKDWRCVIWSSQNFRWVGHNGNNWFVYLTFLACKNIIY